MKKEQYDFLEKLIDAPSPSGFEWPAAKAYRDYVGKFAENVNTDVMGSVVAEVNSSVKSGVMLAGHIDEIGLIVHYIDDKGFVYFSEIGGVDPSVLPGARVEIHTANGPVKGIIGRTAINMLDKEERGKNLKLSDLWIDLGAKDKKEAEKLVSVGDPVTVSYGLEKLQGNSILSRAFDDKAGVFVIAEALRLLANKKPAVKVSAVATTQEETGRRGARTSSFLVDAEVGIAVDVCHGIDYPTASKAKFGDIELGKGPVILRGSNANPKLTQLLMETAKKNKIPFQLEARGNDSGTDAYIMQLNKTGMATAVVSIPLRYMHTPGEVANTEDMENAAKLIALTIAEIKPDTNWTP
jgi:putative aminopeptidase FrvX